jgi:hypothetical protein
MGCTTFYHKHILRLNRRGFQLKLKGVPMQKLMTVLLSSLAVFSTTAVAKGKFVAVCDQVLNSNVSGLAEVPVYSIKASSLFIATDVDEKVTSAQYIVSPFYSESEFGKKGDQISGFHLDNDPFAAMKVKDDGRVLSFISSTNQGGWGEPKMKYLTTYDRQTMFLHQESFAYDQIISLIPIHRYVDYLIHCRQPTEHEKECNQKGYVNDFNRSCD